nr:TRAP transporter substrate-binding protein [Pseudomonas sp.]
MTFIRTMLVSAGAVVCALSLTARDVAAQDSVKLTLGTQANMSMSIGKSLQEVFVPAVERHSNGRLTLDYHGNGALCSEQICIEQMSLGQIDIATVSSGNVGSFGTTFDLINLPFLFKDNESAKRIFDDWLVKELQARAAKELKMHMIALVPVGGFRNLVTVKGPVKEPKDLKGLKIRVTKSPTEFNLIKSWGAAPIPYDWTQLYEGLQSGVVDGMYLQDTFTVGGKFTEVIDHITQINGAYSAHPILMTLDRYQALPDWAREALDKAGQDLMDKGFEYDMQWQKESQAAMQNTVDVYVPNDAEMALWHKGAIAAWVSVRRTYDPALTRRILEEQGQTALIEELVAAKAL